MGTHPIFESDFDCLTDNGGRYKRGKKSRHPNLLQPIKNTNELCGTEAKFYLDVPDSQNALGLVISYISDVFIKWKQSKLGKEEIEFTVAELSDWICSGKVRLLYRVEQEGSANQGFHLIPTARLSRISKAYFMNSLNSDF